MSKEKLYLIGNAHLDPVWLWRWQEGFAEIKATFRSALDRMKEFDDYVFTCGCASYYRWVEENCPEMFAEIGKRVKEGRWAIVGGWWLQPDCNLPSGESFARQGLYAQRYFNEKFGKMASVGYNVDSFGHNAMLPQILKKSGMDSYVFMRPSPEENPTLDTLFNWESPDGSRVTAYRIPISYSCNKDTKEELKEELLKILKVCKAPRLPDVWMAFYGVGNHGGGPTAKNLQFLRELSTEFCDAELIHSTPENYFKLLRQTGMTENLPAHKGELQHHAVGCYSAHSQIKELNRKAEFALKEAEILSVLAEGLTGAAYPAKQLRHAWQTLLFHQFHDILGGCAIKESYDDTRNFIGETLAIAARASNAAAQRISWSINTMGDKPLSVTKDNDWAIWEVENLGAPLVVFNPHPFAVKTNITVNIKATGVSDWEENPVPFQHVRSSQTNWMGNLEWTAFPAELPPMGYRVYRVYKKRTLDFKAEPVLKADENGMENGRILIRFDTKNGWLTSLIDSETGELLNGAGAVPIVIDEEHCDTWAHNVTAFDKEVGRFSDAIISVLENGPVSAKVRIESRYGSSVLTQDFIMCPDSREVKVAVRLDWREKHKQLKLLFDCAVEKPTATYEIPFSHISRPTDGNEVPGLSWVDMSGMSAGKRVGLAIANTSKYSYSANGSRMSIMAVRSPVYADHFGNRDDQVIFTDQGITEFSYLLAPHSGDVDESGIINKAQLLNLPPVSIIETYHTGELPTVWSGIETADDSICISAFKKAEDGNGFILRCYEGYGRHTEAEISLPFLNCRFDCSLSSFEVRTFRIIGETVSETDLIEF